MTDLENGRRRFLAAAALGAAGAASGLGSRDAAAAQEKTSGATAGRLEILAAFRARQGLEDDLRRATLAVVEPTRAEAGCIRFSVLEDEGQPGVFFIRETWESDAALKAHFEQPYLKRLVEQHKTLLDGTLTLHRLKVYD